MSLKVLETRWKRALTSIVEQLTESEFKKMLFDLDKIPQGVKSGKLREEIPQLIIQYYGTEASITVVEKVMKQIPRMDAAVQDLLRPFVDKLKKQQQKKKEAASKAAAGELKYTEPLQKSNTEELRNKNEKGKKRKWDPVKKEENPPAGKKKKRDPVKKEKKAAEGQEKSSQPVKEANADRWKKSIRELKSSSALLDTDVIVGKVVEKSGVRSYQTKENVKKFFFYVAVADETGSIKLMVYGKLFYKQFMEEKTYMFRELTKDENGLVKFRSQSKISERNPVQVPDELQTEARELIYPKSPDYSIADAKRSTDSRVTVKGTITKIDPIEPATGKNKLKTTQRFQIEDDSDSIGICMWGEDTKQCKGLSVGDVIQAANMKINRYHDIISLNSTGFTKIQKVQSADSQSERIEIEGIAKATKKETHLDAFFRDEMHRCVVSSRLLAKAFGFNLDDDIKEKLLDIIPMSADAIIQGGKIKELTAAPVE